MIEEVFDEGYQAFVNGYCDSENPYPRNSANWMVWYDGYIRAEDDYYEEE